MANRIVRSLDTRTGVPVASITTNAASWRGSSITRNQYPLLSKATFSRKGSGRFSLVDSGAPQIPGARGTYDIWLTLGSGADDLVVIQSTANVATAPLIVIGVNGNGQITGRIQDASGVTRAEWLSFDSLRQGDLAHVQVAWDASSAIDSDYHVRVLVNGHLVPRVAYTTAPTASWTPFQPLYVSTGKFCDTGFDGTFLFLQVSSGSELEASNGRAYDPSQQPAVNGWLRLTSSTQVSNEWSSITDVLNVNPATSTSPRRAAVSTSNNGLPVATFDGVSPDVWLWPLQPYNNGTSHWGLGFWVSPSTVNTGGSNTTIAIISNGQQGASGPKLILGQNNASVFFVVYNGTGSNGRVATLSNVFTVNQWTWVRADWTSARTGDDKMRIYVNGALTAPSYADNVTGPIPPDLTTVTGNMLFGNTNSIAPSGNWSGRLGPNVYSLGADISTNDDLALMSFERPT